MFVACSFKQSLHNNHHRTSLIMLPAFALLRWRQSHVSELPDELWILILGFAIEAHDAPSRALLPSQWQWRQLSQLFKDIVEEIFFDLLIRPIDAGLISRGGPGALQRPRGIRPQPCRPLGVVLAVGGSALAHPKTTHVHLQTVEQRPQRVREMQGTLASTREYGWLLKGTCYMQDLASRVEKELWSGRRACYLIWVQEDWGNPRGVGEVGPLHIVFDVQPMDTRTAYEYQHAISWWVGDVEAGRLGIDVDQNKGEVLMDWRKVIGSLMYRLKTHRVKETRKHLVRQLKFVRDIAVSMAVVWGATPAAVPIFQAATRAMLWAMTALSFVATCMGLVDGLPSLYQWVIWKAFTCRVSSQRGRDNL